MLKERHTTAKKLRKYYLQCLKQLLEEDKAALSKNGSTCSDATKLKRMAIALKIPDSEEKMGTSYTLETFLRITNHLSSLH